MTRSGIILFCIFLLALFLRLYRLPENLVFSGELGHNYLAVKNAIATQQFPLVGPPTSHPWLSFGPWFYYLVGFLFLVFGYHPIVPAYFFAVVSAGMVVLHFWVIREMRGRGVRKAMIGALLVAFSPSFLWIAREARFYSMVVYLSYIYFLFLMRVLRGDGKSLLFLGLTVGFMLSFHYAGLILVPGTVYLLWRYGKSERIGKLGLLGGLGVVVPFMPLLIYDAMHGLPMFSKLLVWFPYRLLGALGIGHAALPTPGSDTTIGAIIKFFGSVVGAPSGIGSAIATLAGGLVLILGVKGSLGRLGRVSAVILGMGLGAIVIHGQPPQHYFFPLLPFVYMLYALFLNRVFFQQKSGRKILGFIFVMTILITQIEYLFSPQWFYLDNDQAYGWRTVPFKLQQEVTRRIVADAGGKPFSIKRVGPFDIYEQNYSQNYRYLLWMYGNEPVENDQSGLVYTIYDEPRGLAENQDPANTIQVANITVMKAFR